MIRHAESTRSVRTAGDRANERRLREPTHSTAVTTLRMRQRPRIDIEGRELRPRPRRGRTAPIDERPRNRSSRIDREMACDRCGRRSRLPPGTDRASRALSCGRWSVSDRATSCPRSVCLDACRSNATGCGRFPIGKTCGRPTVSRHGRRRELERPAPNSAVVSQTAGWRKRVEPGGRFGRSNSGAARTSPSQRFPSVNCRDASIQRRTVTLREGGSFPTPHCRNGRQIQRRVSPSMTSDCTPVERLSRGTTPGVKTGRTGFQKCIDTVCLETNNNRQPVGEDYSDRFRSAGRRSVFAPNVNLFGLADAFATGFRPLDIVAMPKFIFVSLYPL